MNYGIAGDPEWERDSEVGHNPLYGDRCNLISERNRGGWVAGRAAISPSGDRSTSRPSTAERRNLLRDRTAAVPAEKVARRG